MGSSGLKCCFGAWNGISMMREYHAHNSTGLVLYSSHSADRHKRAVCGLRHDHSMQNVIYESDIGINNSKACRCHALSHVLAQKQKQPRDGECIQVSVSEHSGGFREGTKRRGTGQSDGGTVIHAASSCYKSRPLSSSFAHAAAADSVETTAQQTPAE